MKARIGVILAVLLVAAGALWWQFGSRDAGTKEPPPVVTPGGNTGGNTGGSNNGGNTGGNTGGTQQPPSLEAQLKARAAAIVPLMKAGDLGALAPYVHPTKGVRFSPYVHSNSTDRIYQANQLSGAKADTATYTWGIGDGSGMPIDLTFQAYWNKFVWPRDFTAGAQIGVDTRLGQGTVSDNTAQTFPGAHWVEYHLPNSGQTNDWASLRLVFEKQGNDWYLVGIILDHWTI